MYLHVGNNKMIREKSIIGIFDMDNATVSTVTRRFLSDCERRGEIESANQEIPKSFVLYDAGGRFDGRFDGRHCRRNGATPDSQSERRKFSSFSASLSPSPDRVCFSQISSTVLKSRGNV